MFQGVTTSICIINMKRTQRVTIPCTHINTAYQSCPSLASQENFAGELSELKFIRTVPTPNITPQDEELAAYSKEDNGVHIATAFSSVRGSQWDN